MFGVPQVVVVDDSSRDLEALISALTQLGSACLGIEYSNIPGEMSIVPCPFARVVVTDLNLLKQPVGSDLRPLFGAVAGVLRDIAPQGPYLLVAWTRLDQEATDLRLQLEEQLVGVAKPFDVIALKKAEFIDLDGNVIDPGGLMRAIENLASSVPAMAILCDWEQRILRAAGDTLASVSMLGDENKPGELQRKDLPRLLSAMAVNSVGEQNVDADPFRAVNEALMPMLQDRIASQDVHNDLDQVWPDAAEGRGAHHFSAGEAAELNRAFHIADDIGALKGAERGAVIPLPKSMRGPSFEPHFGISETQASQKLFRCKNFAPGSGPSRWVLIQCQAACDYAQKNPGPLPFLLGMDIEQSAIDKNRAPQSLWQSPAFTRAASIRQLQVNTRIQVPLVGEVAREQSPLYRLRDQLLGQLLHHAQINNARPGIVSFSG